MAKWKLKDRIIYCRGVCDVVDSAGHSSSRPSKYKSWNEVKTAQAFSAVTQEKISIREAALQFGVPKSTLGDRVSGQILIEAK
jgi:phage portal protein BeeE